MKHHASSRAASLAFLASIVTSAPFRRRRSPRRSCPPELLAKNVGDLTAAGGGQFAEAAEATMERVCIACHPFENITKTRRTAREWSDQVHACRSAARRAPNRTSPLSRDT